MKTNTLYENMKRFKTLNLIEQQAAPQQASPAGTQSGLNMQAALSKASSINGLSFGKYLKNIKGIATSMVKIGEELLMAGGSADNKEMKCKPIVSEMNSLAPLATDLLDRMRSDAQNDLIQKKLLPADATLSWDEYASLMSKHYETGKVGLMSLVKPILRTALAAAKMAMRISGADFYVDSAIVAMLSQRIKTHCGNKAGGIISSVLMDSISSVIPVKSTGLTC
jgi:hypothetical protein